MGVRESDRALVLGRQTREQRAQDQQSREREDRRVERRGGGCGHDRASPTGLPGTPLLSLLAICSRTGSTRPVVAVAGYSAAVGAGRIASLHERATANWACSHRHQPVAARAGRRSNTPP
jgi:hypothetical protein